MTTAMIGRDAELAAILAFLRRSPAAPRARLGFDEVVRHAAQPGPRHARRESDVRGRPLRR
jgi:hypothetical protein